MPRRISPSTIPNPRCRSSTPTSTAKRTRAIFGVPMPIQVLMPALSPTMEKGNLAKWLKKEGDTIKSGDVIAEIETDKATMEVEAIDEGKLGRILIPAGTERVAVNTVIALLAAEGENIDVPPARPNGAAPAAAKPAEAPASLPPAAPRAASVEPRAAPA